MTTIDPSTVATMQGRELDAAVHEHVCGPHEKELCPQCEGYGKAHDEHLRLIRCWHCEGTGKMFAESPYYTAFRAAFFAMVDAVRAKGWSVETYYGADDSAYVTLDHDTHNNITQRGVTAEMCTLLARAALLACLSDVKEPAK